MRGKILTSSLMLCLIFASCSFTDGERPSTLLDDVKPADLFYRLTPPCSAGNHFLPPPEATTEYVWLFGAYNNGRHEENVLVEKNGESIRLRAFWHLNSGDLVCCDTKIDGDEFTKLQSDLMADKVLDLPNIAPSVSHAMTYWLKFSDGTNNHESCAYCIDLSLIHI